ncbi:GntR family transcriptional regulator [Streptosporangium sp. NPDC048865]|uniref:GntR family transcriptional regulator n=1 Tax=Streptosporangium sp. NPDC048865 TaxID=3155766 RepID=UPI0034203989
MADLHLVVDRAAGGVAAQIARELREAIRRGRLAAGVRLPASRELARDLGLSRGVVVEAYEQLVAEGFLISRVGAGTAVAPAAGRPAPPVPPALPEGSEGPSRVPETHGGASGGGARDRDGEREPYHGRRSTAPDLGAFPRERWLASMRRTLAALPAEALDYGDPGGVPALREELAAYLRRVRAADVGPDNLVVVGGVAQGISLTIQALAGRLPRGRSPHDLGWYVRRAARPVPPPGRIRLAVEDPAGGRQLPLLHAAGAPVGAGAHRLPPDHPRRRRRVGGHVHRGPGRRRAVPLARQRRDQGQPAPAVAGAGRDRPPGAPGVTAAAAGVR